jgi:hypothetical protein
VACGNWDYLIFQKSTAKFVEIVKCKGTRHDYLFFKKKRDYLFFIETHKGLIQKWPAKLPTIPHETKN